MKSKKDLTPRQERRELKKRIAELRDSHRALLRKELTPLVRRLAVLEAAQRLQRAERALVKSIKGGNSPELNPVEYLWDHLPENYMGNQVFASWDAFVDHLCADLDYLHQHPEVVRSMTCFDWIETLSLTLN
jgi:transposase